MNWKSFWIGFAAGTILGRAIVIAVAFSAGFVLAWLGLI